jgi:hypothetical protein
MEHETIRQTDGHIGAGRGAHADSPANLIRLDTAVLKAPDETGSALGMTIASRGLRLGQAAGAVPAREAGNAESDSQPAYEVTLHSNPTGDGAAAEHAGEWWESVLPQYVLPRGARAEVLTWFCRCGYALRVTAHDRVTGLIEAAEFRTVCAEHGLPAAVRTDEDVARKARLAGGCRPGSDGSQDSDLSRLGIARQNRHVPRPQDKGVAERFQHALLRWLVAQNPQPASLTELRKLLDAFTACYNDRRASRRDRRHIARRQPQAKRLEKHVPAVEGAARPRRSIRPPRPSAGGSA